MRRTDRIRRYIRATDAAKARFLSGPATLETYRQLTADLEAARAELEA